MKFELGDVVITRGCKAYMDGLNQDPLQFLQRHVSGDWGDLGKSDKSANEHAIGRGLRILSRYTLCDGTGIYIITEGDQSSTCVMLCDEY